MTVTTLTSREFNQDTGRAKTAARTGPVYITDRGTPAHVLLTFEAYQRLTGGGASIVDLLGLPAAAVDVELQTPRSRELPRPAELT
jgi:hypothetical protein